MKKVAETKWTKEQQSAIDTRGCNLLVAAAAGSGKTAVLVQRIIKMITEEKDAVDIDKLLVVTFTNAAAAEMRERIGDAISKELDKFPDSKVLQRQLTLLSKSNITTMHSFCLDVIRNNFHYIDLDPNFRIADSTEALLLKQEVIQDLFEEKYEEEDKGFLTLVDCFTSGKNDIRLQEIVDDLYDFSMSGPWPEKWLLEKAEDFNLSEDFDIANSIWGKVIIENINLELNGIKEKLLQALKLCEASQGLEPYGETIKEDFQIIEDIDSSMENSFEELYKTLSSVKFKTIKKCGKDADKDAQERVKALRDEVKKKTKALSEDFFEISPKEMKDTLCEMYPVMKALSMLVIEFDQRYKLRKKERGLLDFNDLEHLCLHILTEKDEQGNIIPSNVALELREKFEEVLVDEYQDSNSVQETIINMVSRKNTDRPNVFMVGDVKQSIYRFRQARPELFLEKYKEYPEEEGYNNRKILLYKNFRSREEVINSVNYIFKSIMSRTIGELEYDEKEVLNLGASFKENNEESTIIGGSTELHIINRSGKEEVIEESSDSGEQEESGILEEEDLDNIQLEARFVAKRIKELMNPSEEGTFKVYDKELGDYRPVKYKDIVILMRATSNWAPSFVEELGAEGIPVYADAGSGYFQTVEIRTVMALLQVIDNPLQDIPMISVLRSPIFSFTPEELIDLRIYNREKYFYEAIKEIAIAELEDLPKEVEQYEYEKNLKKKCQYVIECIDRWRERSLHTPIDEFIWYLYTDTSYYGFVRAMPNGAQRQANLRILFQRARQYEKTSFKGLFNFINFINKLKKSNGDMGSAKILGENEDVVRIMSIHKSKGLEFPVVILSGAGKNFNLMDLNKDILFHEEMGYGPDYINLDRRISYPTIAKQAIRKKFKLESLSEEMRILYVAFTRAKEKLIITGSVADIEKSSEKWCYSAAQSKDKVSANEIYKGKSYLDWVGMALAKHKAGEVIRTCGKVNFNIEENQDLSKWDIKLWNKDDIIVDKNPEDVDEFYDIEELFIDKQDKNREIISQRLDWVYKYIYSSNIPANISVSELKREALRDEAQDNVFNLYKSKIIKKPLFLQENRGLSSAEKGTAIHNVMQHLDLDKVDDFNSIKDQLDLMVAKELMTLEEVKAVRIQKILTFFESAIGQRILKVYSTNGKVYREVPFYMHIPSTLVKKDLPEDIYKEEKVRVQGVIDCFFEEEDGIVLVDYKTDYVGEKGLEEIKERYKIQIAYYEEALRRVTGKPVKEKYLYLFYNNALVEI